MAPLTRTALPSGFFAIPVGLFFLSCTFGSNVLYSAGFGILGCLVVSLGRAGIEISPDAHSYREYYSLFNWRSGRWQQLPPIVGVTLKQYAELTPVNPRYSWGIWNSAPTLSKELILMLSIQNSSTGMILSHFSVSDTDQAIECAHEVAKVFNVKVNIYLPSINSQ